MTKKVLMGLVGLIVISAFTLLSNSDLSETSIDIAKDGVEIVSQMKDPVHGFNTRVEYKDDGVVRVYFAATMDETWHVYSHYTPDGGPLPLEEDFSQIKFLKAIGKVKESPYHKEYDENFGVDVYSFDKKFEFWQDFKVTDLKAVEKVTIEIAGQTCTTVDGMCIPFYKDATIDIDASKVKVKKPVEKKVEEKTSTTNDDSENSNEKEVESADDVNEESESLMTASDVNAGDSGKEDSSSEEKAKKEVEEFSFMSIFWKAFIAALLALLTPCVFPMIPLTVTFFTKMSGSKMKNRMNAFVYAGSIILIFVIITIPFHILEGVNGNVFNSISTNTYVNLFFFAIFIVFAISFLGGFELTLPSSWINKADKASQKGGLVGIFFMAIVLVLVSFSCTGPVLGILLGNVLETNEGAMALTIGFLGFGFGFALPFGLFAWFPSLLDTLPKSGGWMNSVKVVLGLVELALAFKFLSNADLVEQWGFLKRETFIAIWIAIFAITTIYLLGFFKMKHDSPLQGLSTTRIIFAILFGSFTVYLIPGMSGAQLGLVSGFPPPMFYSELAENNFVDNNLLSDHGDADSHSSSCPLNLNCFHDYDEGVAYAKEVGKPILLDFTGWACVNCRRMEENVWPKDDVYAYLKDSVVLISLYVDSRIELPKEEQEMVFYKGKERMLETEGDKWSYLQESKYKANYQPQYILLDHQEEELNQPVGYTPDVMDYASWLKDGVKAFNNSKK